MRGIGALSDFGRGSRTNQPKSVIVSGLPFFSLLPYFPTAYNSLSCNMSQQKKSKIRKQHPSTDSSSESENSAPLNIIPSAAQVFRFDANHNNPQLDSALSSWRRAFLSHPKGFVATFKDVIANVPEGERKLVKEFVMAAESIAQSQISGDSLAGVVNKILNEAASKMYNAHKTAVCVSPNSKYSLAHNQISCRL